MTRDQRKRIKHLRATLTEREADVLLGKLCAELGFCLGPEKQAAIASAPPDDIDEFAKLVFVEEGLDPVTASTELYHQVRDRVARAFSQHVQGAET